MKRIITALQLAIIVAAPAFSQRYLTLRECYDSLAVNAPSASDREAIGHISELRERNLGIAYLPAIEVTGSYSYNSDVVDMSSMLGGVSAMFPSLILPDIPHDQYRAMLNVNQLIWDGGVTRSAREIEQITLELNMQQNEADIYKMREQVNNYYFSILLTEKQIEITDILISELESRINVARSAVENGVILKINLDVLIAEKLKADQAMAEMKLRHQALMSVLMMLTGNNDIEGAVLLLPETEMAFDTEIMNPDIKLFDIRTKQLDATSDLLRAQRMPKAFGSASLGYGNPQGNNMLSSEAGSFYSFGFGLRWEIFDWNRNRNEIAIIRLQKNITESKKRTAEEGLQRILRLKRAEIESLLQAAGPDKELVEIRKGITAAAASQLENGTLTATEYLTELNAERQARLTAEIHRITLSKSYVDYMNITGKEIK